MIEITCIIVDDDEFSRKLLSDMLKQLGSVKILKEYALPAQAANDIISEKVIPDVLFLDYHMPNLTGYEVVNSINKKIPVIIVSSDGNKAVEAFDYENIIDFLNKPIELSRIVRAINKLNSYLKSTKEGSKSKLNDHVFVNVDKVLIKLNLADIVFVKAFGDYVIFRTNEGKNHIVHKTLKTIEAQLYDTKFQKVHRSFIINIDYIKNIEDNSILIEDELIPIGRKYKSDLSAKLNML